MAHGDAVSIQLEQRKLYTGVRYAVQTRLLEFQPAKLAAPFILGAASGDDRERLLRVAVSSELDTVPLSELAYLVQTGINWTTYSIDVETDTIRIFSPPAEWGDPDGLVPSPYKSFALESFTSSRLKFKEPAWTTPANNGALSWALMRNTTTLASGTAGSLERTVATPLSEWRVSRYVYADRLSGNALDHILAIQAKVRSLADEVSKDPATYLAAAPGNPVINSYNF